MRAHGGFHFALYEASRSAWLVRLIRPAWESCERYRAALLAQQGSLQDRHQEIDQELLAACVARDAGRAADALYRHLELFGDFYSRELGGRGIFEN
jgi:DNA-binding GntR family transcriptional regulator